jgi:hypothetical protein
LLAPRIRWFFEACQGLFRGRENPASKRPDGGIAQAVLANDKLVIVVAQFGAGKRTDQAARREVRLDQRQRSQCDAEAVGGGLKLQIGVIEFEMPDRRQAGNAGRGKPLRPGRSRRR